MHRPRSGESTAYLVYRCRVRVSEFWQAVSEEFGDAYGSTVTTDIVLSEFDRTAVQAIAAGDDTRDIWLALCRATDVPRERRYGVGQLNRT